MVQEAFRGVTAASCDNSDPLFTGNPYVRGTRGGRAVQGAGRWRRGRLEEQRMGGRQGEGPVDVKRLWMLSSEGEKDKMSGTGLKPECGRGSSVQKRTSVSPASL